MSRSNTVLSMVVFLLGSGAEDDLFVMFEDRLLDTQPASYGVASPRTAIALLNNGCHTSFRASYFVMLRGCKKLTDCARFNPAFLSMLR